MKYPTIGLLFGVLVINSVSAVEGYLTDDNGNIAKNSYGQCWHTGTWTPEMAVEECDPEFVKKPQPLVQDLPKKESPITIAKINEEKAQEPIIVAAKETKEPVLKSEQKTLSSKVIFDFDQALLKKEAKDKLDELVNQLKSNQVVEIKIEGYADPLGSEAYNLTLSQARTATVKDYLVSQGVKVNAIQAEGKGTKDLIIRREECKSDNKTNKGLISCLAPNRRAEIKMVILVQPQMQARR